MQSDQEQNFWELEYAHPTESSGEDHRTQVLQWVARIKSEDNWVEVLSDLEKLPLDFRCEVMEFLAKHL